MKTNIVTVQISSCHPQYIFDIFLIDMYEIGMYPVYGYIFLLGYDVVENRFLLFKGDLYECLYQTV
jgi:hypothetical protein